MKKERSICHDFDNVMIKPARYKHASYIENSHYVPIFTYPDKNIVNLQNIEALTNLGITVVIPKCFSDEEIEHALVPVKQDDIWIELDLQGLIGFVKALRSSNKFDPKLSNAEECHYKILYKGNAHDRVVFEICKEAKVTIKGLKIAVGNLLDVGLFKEYHKFNTDYVIIGDTAETDCGVGNSLYEVLREIKEWVRIRATTKIILDFYPKDHKDIIKAIGLGADYVMLREPLLKSFYPGCHYFYSNDLNGHCGLDDTDLRELSENRSYITKKTFGRPTLYDSFKWVRVGDGVEKKISGNPDQFLPVDYYLDEWVKELEEKLKDAVLLTDSPSISSFKILAEYTKIDK